MTTSSFASSSISPDDRDGSCHGGLIRRLLFPAPRLLTIPAFPCYFFGSFSKFCGDFSSLVKFGEVFCPLLQESAGTTRGRHREMISVHVNALEAHDFEERLCNERARSDRKWRNYACALFARDATPP
jgi:hypothetical protein